MKNAVILIISLLITAQLTLAANTIYVGPARTYTTIQAGINAAIDGDTVIVDPGTYTGDGNRDIDFLGKAITVRSQNGPENCTIDCQATENEKHRAFYFHNNEDADSVLEGFTITNGYGHGGGIRCLDSSPTIKDCIITNNYARGDGGGMWLRNSHPIITNCIISENQASDYYAMGGGILCRNGSSPIISNCTMTGNDSGVGGALCMLESTGTVISCIIEGNSADRGGGLYLAGGIFSGRIVTVSNCNIVHNSADSGGGIALSQSLADIVSCTISDNYSSKGSALYCHMYDRPTISNSILWGNTGSSQIYRQQGGHVYINYSDVQGGWSGEGNIDADPGFVQPGYWDVNDVWVDGDYHLFPGSPCIDTGDPCYVAGPNETDIDGQPRVMGGGIDMGADEVVIVIMKFTPQSLNPGSKGNWVKAHFVLPEDFTVDDVDTGTPALIEPLGIESEYMNVFINEDGLVEVEAAFSRAEFCGTVMGNEPVEVTVTGLLTTGQQFYGTDTIRIINNNLEYLTAFSSYWLRTDCGQPDWCGGLDLDQNSTVNFIDFALLDGCCIEVINQ